ncbi:hypothetical protein [Bradyrhizobium japonicum]|uniref:hypothetical protein n=1 Tax=Bradyrhizobium japonicum TaxID=375 RepID=UPI003D233036
MVQSGWRPTVENYLGRRAEAPHPWMRCARAPAERAAQLIDHLKKATWPRRPSGLLAETSWLPEPLRMANIDQAASVDAVEPAGAGETLPEFLTGDDEEAPADEAYRPHMIAAE